MRSDGEMRDLIVGLGKGGARVRGGPAGFAMGVPFRRLGTEVAARSRFEYPHADDRRVSGYLERVRATGSPDGDPGSHPTNPT